MNITVKFRLDSEIALNLDRFCKVDWDAVVADAIRTKAKMLRQSQFPVPAVNRDPAPSLESPTVGEPVPVKPPRLPKPVRVKEDPAPLPKFGRRPVPPAEVVASRRELLRSTGTVGAENS